MQGEASPYDGGIAGLFAAASEHAQDDEIKPTASADERRSSQKLAAIKESIQIAEAVLGGARFTVKLSHFLLDEALYSPHVLGVSARAEAEYFKSSRSNYEAQMFASGDYELRSMCTRAYPILSALEDAVAIAQDPESSFSKSTAELQSLCSHKQILLHYRGKQYLRDDLRILYATACQALPIAMVLADEIRHYATSAISGSPGMPFELLSGSISAPDGVPTSHRQFPNIAIPGTLHRAFQTLQNAGFQMKGRIALKEGEAMAMGCVFRDGARP
ncbi:hypothetical protein F503_00991 [Ophiostoma piceae UAMH 11346]|uniref:Uncharacterized protein n=1 Tax=Ophiostoma piceae (strain UAMH 11346) TaxID=1262450 RepID=S3CNW2_OPHP1|nr:hypothetical protein F503_00991 [Ophiostoma piceae UAMH 11346]